MQYTDSKKAGKWKVYSEQTQEDDISVHRKQTKNKYIYMQFKESDYIPFKAF